MNKEDLIKLKEKLSKLSEEEKKERDLYLRKLAIGEIQGPLTGYASIDKPWLKYYQEKDLFSDVPKKTIYRYAADNNMDNNGTALRYYGNKISYKEFFENIDKAANSLAFLGVKKGDIVTICSPTFPETIYINYALNKIGAIANNIDPRNNASRIEDILNESNTNILFVLDIAYPKIDKIIDNTSVKKTVCISYLDSIPKIEKSIFQIILNKELKTKGLSIPKIKYGDKYINYSQFISLGYDTKAKEIQYEKNLPVAMVMTGGTTGFPKYVVLLNDSALSVIESYKFTDLKLERGQSLLNIMPQFIAYGWTFGVAMAPSLGIEDIIIPQFDINKFDDYLIKYKPNHVVGVPSHYLALQNSNKMKKVDLGKFLVSISAGGDYYQEEHEKSFNNFLHLHGYDKNVIIGFGLTENNSSVATRLNKCNISGSVGVPLIKNSIAIFKEENGISTDVELGYNEIGEICILSSSNMAGYFNNDVATSEILIKHSDGNLWTHTKDIGYIDENGILYTNGRVKNMIIRPDGHNVWPSEMEKIILKHPFVEECCVVGIPSNEKQGEYPIAIVRLKDIENVDTFSLEQELRKMCFEMLPERDVPYGYVFTSNELLKTGVGKIDRNQIRENELLRRKIKKKEK